jgi:hypothetical protein
MDDDTRNDYDGDQESSYVANRHPNRLLPLSPHLLIESFVNVIWAQYVGTDGVDLNYDCDVPVGLSRLILIGLNLNGLICRDYSAVARWLVRISRGRVTRSGLG